MANGTHKISTSVIGNDIDVSALADLTSNTVERQRVSLGDPADFAALAAVKNTSPLETDYAIATRNIYPASARAGFGQLSVAQETCVASINFVYGLINTDVCTTAVANSATATVSNTNHATLSTGTNAAGSATLKSNRGARYTPGQGMVARFTALFTAGASGSRQLIGVGDASNGLFFGYSGSSFGIVRRFAGVDTFVSASNFNVDKLDGTGPSGMTIATATGNVFEIKFQWLGYGAVFFSVENANTGRMQVVHVLTHANANTNTTIATPHVSLYAEAINAGNTTSMVLKTPSMGLFLEGTNSTPGLRRCSIATKSGVTTEVPVLTLRNNSTFNSVANNTRLRFDYLTLSSTAGNADLVVRAYVNVASLTGASYTNFNASTSIAAVDTSATAFTGGTSIHALNVGTGGQTSQILRDLDIMLNPGNTLTFTAQTTGSAATARLGVSWNEEF